KLLGFIMRAAVLAFFQDIKGVDPLDVQSFGQHERYTIVPGQREPGALLAGLNMFAYIVDLDALPYIAYRSTAVAGGAQLSVLIYGKAGWGLVADQPVGHGRSRGLLD